MKTLKGVAITFSVAVLASGVARGNGVLFDWVAYYNGTTVSTTCTSGTSVCNSEELAGQVSFSTMQVDATHYNLVIALTNLAPIAAPDSSHLLDGIYFNIQQGTTGPTGGTTPTGLQMVSAYATETTAVSSSGNGNNKVYSTANTTYANPGTTICSPTKSPATSGGGVVQTGCSSTVSGGWEFAYNTAGIGGGSAAKQLWGIGTSGQGGAFNGNDVNPFDYAVLPSSGIAATSSLCCDTYVFSDPTHVASFTFTGLTSGSIYVTSVQAAYGTAPEAVANSHLDGGEAPEPGTVAMMTVGAVLLLFVQKRRRGNR